MVSLHRFRSLPIWNLRRKISVEYVERPLLSSGDRVRRTGILFDDLYAFVFLHKDTIAIHYLEYVAFPVVIDLVDIICVDNLFIFQQDAVQLIEVVLKFLLILLNRTSPSQCIDSP